MPLDDGLQETPEARANRLARFDLTKEKFARLDEIEAEKKALADEEEEIRASLEKDSGYARGAVASVRKTKKLGSAAAIQKHLENRAELEEIFIKPILDAAAAGQEDE